MVQVITSVNEFANIIASAKRGGQFVSLKGATDYNMNKYNTDGGPREHIKPNFQPRVEFFAKFHFGQDYEKTMAKALGVNAYTASDSNREHLVHNVLMRYKSTGTICLIYLPTEYRSGKMTIDGRELTTDEMNYAKRFKSPSRKSMVEYRTLSLRNLTQMTIGGETYEIKIS